MTKYRLETDKARACVVEIDVLGSTVDLAINDHGERGAWSVAWLTAGEAYELGKEMLRAALKAGYLPPRPKLDL